MYSQKHVLAVVEVWVGWVPGTESAITTECRHPAFGISAVAKRAVILRSADEAAVGCIGSAAIELRDVQHVVERCPTAHRGHGVHIGRAVNAAVVSEKHRSICRPVEAG